MTPQPPVPHHEGNHVLDQRTLGEHEAKYHCHEATYQFLNNKDGDNTCLCFCCCRILLLLFCIVPEVFGVFVKIGCTIGKLLPPSLQYIGCSSARCQKVAHNAI
jgi:hypothetical protein